MKTSLDHRTNHASHSPAAGHANRIAGIPTRSRSRSRKAPAASRRKKSGLLRRIAMVGAVVGATIIAVRRIRAMRRVRAAAHRRSR